MKKAVALFLILLPTLVVGQVIPLYQELITTSPVKPSIRELEKLNSHIQTLRGKEVKSEKKLLQLIFRTTHQNFLKSYSQYTDLGDLFVYGQFDCLTATSLFGIILDELNFDYKIIETNYHIFILVNTKNGQVLLETTDRLAGLVDDPAEISNRIESYRQNEIVKSDDNNPYYNYSFNLYQEVSPDQLAGLLYFNQAIKAYNKHDLLQCSSLLEQSLRIYESPRVEELAIILVKSVLESNLSFEIKSRVILKYKNFIVGKDSPVASY